MSLRSRLQRIVDTLGRPEDMAIPVILDGIHDEDWRERVVAARARGQRILLSRVSVTHEAATVEEAEGIIDRHRDEGHGMAITVYRAGTGVLAEWDPGLPEWLRTIPS